MKRKKPKGRPLLILTAVQRTEFALLYPATDNKALAALFAITPKQVKNLASNLDLKKANHLWTEAEKKYVEDNYFSQPRILTAQKIANDLGRSRAGVIEMIRKLKND